MSARLQIQTVLGFKSMAAAEAAAAAAVSSSSSLVADTALVPATAETAAATAATSPSTAAAEAVAAVAKTGSEATVSKASLASKLLSLSGVFAVHKPKGPTSAELLNRLKEKLLAGTAARVGTRPRRSPRERKPHGAPWAFLRFMTPERKGRERVKDHCLRSGQKSGASRAWTRPDVNSCSLVGSWRSQGNKA